MALRADDRPEPAVKVSAAPDVVDGLLDVELVQPAEEGGAPGGGLAGGGEDGVEELGMHEPVEERVVLGVSVLVVGVVVCFRGTAGCGGDGSVGAEF